MHLRSILSGTLAAAAPVQASPPWRATRAAGSSADSGLAFHLPDASACPASSATAKRRQVQLAQASDPRVTGLEDQIRALNGTIEELNFQVLQMQEQIRKQQEDNEFRFQELEDGRAVGRTAARRSSPSAGGEHRRAPPAAAPAEPECRGRHHRRRRSSESSAITRAGAPARRPTARRPRRFGTITVDKNGNVIDAGGNTQATDAGARRPRPMRRPPAASGTVVAALPATDDPGRTLPQFLPVHPVGRLRHRRDRVSAITSPASPRTPKTADAHYWLGESLLGQQKYRDAAEVFLAASKDYPKAKKAPDMLLKLGVSLVGLKQRDVACATFGEIGKRYPDISSALKERVKQEQALASC